MKVRQAKIEDFPEVCRMAKSFYACTEYQSIEFDDASCFLLFKDSLDKGMCFVSESECITGFILGLPFPCPMNRLVTMATELAWWVEPLYRNTSAGVKLLKALEESAEQNGCVSLSMICLESLEPEKIQSIYQRIGYVQVERTFLRAL